MRGNQRLISITGPGGIGKSALARQVSADTGDGFPDGVFFIPLAGLRYPELLGSAIAAGLDIRQPATVQTERVNAAHVGERRYLIVLDNVDHLLAATTMLDSLLSSCPNLSILVTSRAPMVQPNEEVFEIGPLALPKKTDALAVETLREVASVHLFIERASEPDHRFELAAKDGPVITDICLRLAGLPLAIELVASRAQADSLKVLHARLTTMKEAVTPGEAEPVTLQRIMYQTIAWSYGQLDDSQRELLKRIAIHAGGFDLAAAEAVAAAQTPVSVPAATGLEELVRWRLVIRSGHADAPTRFELLQPIRDFVLERLNASAELKSVRIAHAAHYLELAQRYRSLLLASDPMPALDWYRREQNNLRGAIGASIRSGHANLAGSLVAALWPFWGCSGDAAEGRRWIKAALALDSVGDPGDAHPELLFAAAMLALDMRDVRAARRSANDGLVVAKARQDDFWHTAMLVALGQAAAQAGDADRALSLYRLVLKAMRPLRASRPLTSYLEALTHLSASSAYLTGKVWDDAEFHANEALRFYIRQGNKHGISMAKLNLAMVSAARGSASQALDFFADSLPALWEFGDAIDVARGLSALAEIAAEAGKAELCLGAAEMLIPMESPESLPRGGTMDTSHIVARLRNLANENAIAKAMEEGGALARQDLIALIQEAIAGLHDRLAPPKRGAGRTGASSLSRREREVLCLMVEGMTDQQIADALFISYRTVNSHVEHIFGKLGVNTRSAAVAFAIRQELC